MAYIGAVDQGTSSSRFLVSAHSTFRFLIYIAILFLCEKMSKSNSMTYKDCGAKKKCMTVYVVL